MSGVQLLPLLVTMSTVLTPLTTYRGSIHGPSTAADHDTSQQRNFPTTITSLNVNGMFTDEDKQRRVADTISGSGAMLAANYVLIQEVKANHRDEALDIDACKTLASNVNPGGRCWITPYCMTMASPHDDATEVEAYSALNGRVIILHAEGMRIVNLYAPAEHKERRMFYNLLATVIEPGDDLLFGGDWNLTPDPSQPFNWQFGNVKNRHIGGPEMEAMLAGMRTGGVHEVNNYLKIPGTFRDFTYISPTQHGVRRLRRLDWFATSPTILHRIQKRDVTTSPFWLPGGDHAAVTIRVTPIGYQPPPKTPEGGAKRQPAIHPGIAAVGEFHAKYESLVKEATVKAADADDETILQITDSLIDDINDAYAAHSKEVRERRHAVTKAAIHKYDELLDSHPDPATWTEDFHADRHTATKAIVKLLDSASQERRYTVDIDFTTCANSDRELYRTVNTDNTATNFTSQQIFVPTLDNEQSLSSIQDSALRAEIAAGPGWTTPALAPQFTQVTDDGDGYTNTQEGMLGNARNFYVALYRLKTVHRGCLAKVLRCLPKRNRLSPQALCTLGDEMCVDEVVAAIKRLKDGKACGPDGICAELLKRNPQLLAPLLTRTFNAAHRLSHGSRHMMENIITLIFKAGDARDLGNMRPISLRNKIGSILAEVIKVRLRPLLPCTTMPDQVSAAPGRAMYESIFKVLDSLEIAKLHDLPMAMLLNDMSKAFDIVDKDYLRQVLLILCGHQYGDKHCEIDENGQLTPTGKLLRWIDVLIGTAEHPLRARVLVNGQLSDSIDILSGTPQGLEISAQLYCIANEGLMGLLLEAGVVGLTMSPYVRSDSHTDVHTAAAALNAPLSADHVTFSASRYADDFIAFVLLDHLHLVLDLLDIYCAGTAQSSNASKTMAFGIGRYATVDACWETHNRVVWRKPADACGPVLGIVLGPAANPSDQWAKVSSAMFTNIRRWHRHTVAYRGRTELLSTYVWSKSWFLGSFFAPSAKLLGTLEAASRQFIWKGAITNGTTPLSSAKLLHHSSRHAPERLHNIIEHGGLDWVPASVRFMAIHAMWIVHLLTPRRHNYPADCLAAWYDPAVDMIARHFDIPVAHDGDVATQVREALLLSSHFDGQTRVTCGILPQHWTTFLRAWAMFRRHLTLREPITHEQVLAAPLFTDSRNPCQLTPAVHAAWMRQQLTHVRHLWNHEHCRLNTADELGVTPAAWHTVTNTISPRRRALLQAGTTPFTTGHWVLLPSNSDSAADFASPPGQGTLAQLHTELSHGYFSLTMYSLAPCGGWRPAGYHAASTTGMRHATVDVDLVAPDGGGRVHWLVGATDTCHWAGRGTMQLAKKSLAKVEQADIRATLREPSTMSTSALRVLGDIGGPDRRTHSAAFLVIVTAPWTPTVRNFAWDLATGALPCGQGITGIHTSACQQCCGRAPGVTPRDTVAHLTRDCPLLAPLRDLYTEIWAALQWRQPAPPFATMLVYGHAPRCGNADALTAIRGAILASARWARVVSTAAPFRAPAVHAIRRLA